MTCALPFVTMFFRKEPKNGQQIFSRYKMLNNLRRMFERHHQKTAHKFGNPRMLKITFHTLRHWKAAMEYHKIKDILHVMRMLGHRRIETTLPYTQLVQFENEDEYHSAIAETVEEAKKLVEAGFEYVTDYGDGKFFRKRK